MLKQALKILSEAEGFWKEKFSRESPSSLFLFSYFEMILIVIQPVDPFKAPPPLTIKGHYNSTSHASLSNQQANLCKGAAGSAKISVFFCISSETHQTTN